MKTKSNAGFSLVELMVVVAIIGVLATIAVPNYMKFQNKAKQASAKSELAGIYTAEKAFFIEYSSYLNILPVVGYVPEGYTATCATAAAAAYNGNARIYATGFSGAPPAAAAMPPGVTQPANCNAAANGTTFYVNTVGAALAIPAAAVANANTFIAASTGILAAADTWTMNENRVLTNTVPGI